MLATFEQRRTPAACRLKALARHWENMRDLIADQGCPIGSLCAELSQRGDGPWSAAELIRVPVDWAERQFQAMGSPDPRDLAVEVIARYQGTALLASTFRDPSLMEGEGRRVARWIDALG